MVKGKKAPVKKAKRVVKGRSAKKALGRGKAAPRKKRGLVLLANPGVRQLLIDMAGEDTLAVIKEFSGEMSDDELARKTKIKVSDVRAVLNKLHSSGLVKYTRNRDKDSGWYTYLWKLAPGRMEEVFLPHLGAGGKGGGNSGAVAAEEGREYYVCGGCGPETRVPFEEASDQLFKCKSCGSLLKLLE